MEYKQYEVDENDLVSAIDRIDVGSIKDGCIRTKKTDLEDVDLEQTVRDYFLKHIELSRRGEFVPSKKVSFNEAVRDFDRYWIMRSPKIINRMNGYGLYVGVMPWMYDFPKPTTSEINDWIMSWGDDGKRYTLFKMVVRNEFPTYHITADPYYMSNGRDIHMLAIIVIGKEVSVRSGT
jgi:hypothetical protein